MKAPGTICWMSGCGNLQFNRNTLHPHRAKSFGMPSKKNPQETRAMAGPCLKKYKSEGIFLREATENQREHNFEIFFGSLCRRNAQVGNWLVLSRESGNDPYKPSPVVASKGIPRFIPFRIPYLSHQMGTVRPAAPRPPG